MTCTPPQPTQWHRRADGDTEQCSICACPLEKLGTGGWQQHQAIHHDYPGWRRRTRRGGGFRVYSIDLASPRAAGCKKTGMTAALRERIARAASMVAHGQAAGDIAKRFHVQPTRIYEWKAKYPGIWKAAFDAAMVELVELVRTSVGTDAVAADPERHLQQARHAEKWLQAKGEPLFAPTDKPTLCSFYTDHYLPNILFEAAASTTRNYESILRRWRLFTGDPPLEEITSTLLAKFRDTCAKLRGKDGISRLSPNRVRAILRTLDAFLNKAGPPGPRNRDAVGLIDKVPWCRPPRKVERPRTIATKERISDVYTSAIAMELPAGLGFKPPAWWRALLVVASCTGLRRRTLFELRMTDIDWQRGALVIPAKRMKAGRPHTIPLHPVAVDHLRRIRTDRELVFAWPHSMKTFDRRWHALQDAAGIPQVKHFTLQTLRRTLATSLFAVNPEAAKMALGHVSIDTTIGHYVRPDEIVAAALQQVSVPEVFQGTGEAA